MNLQIVNDKVSMTLPNGSVSMTTASVEQVMELVEYSPVKWFQFWRKRQTVTVTHNNETFTFKA